MAPDWRWSAAYNATDGGIHGISSIWIILPMEIKTRRGTTVFDTDEHVRPDANIEDMAKLRPAFEKEGGTVTAAMSFGAGDRFRRQRMRDLTVEARIDFAWRTLYNRFEKP